MIPVFSYYQLLQSKPTGGRRGRRRPRPPRRPGDDGVVLGRCPPVLRAGTRKQAGRRCTSSRTCGATSSRPPAATTPRPFRRWCRRHLPQTAAGFAQEFVRLRDALAPNVILAYHMSGWGTRHDIVYEKPPNATVRAYAARSAAFYRSLGARFDVAFEDFPTGTPATTRSSSTSEHMVQAGRLRAAPALRRNVRAPRRNPDGGLADPAREYRDARREQHDRPLPGQPRAVAARPELARPPARIRRGGLRRLPLRPRRRRQHVRLRRSERRGHEPGADRRQYGPLERPTTTAATSDSRHARTTRPSRCRCLAEPPSTTRGAARACRERGRSR